MELAKVTSKGQVTIPAAVRRRLGVGSGDKVLFLYRDDSVVMVNATLEALKKVQDEFAGVAEEYGIETEDDVVDLVKQVRRERG